MFRDFKPYVSVGAKRASAERRIRKLKKQGKALSPITIEGRTIARTFWGKSWCELLEAFSDFSNRLPRGRSYVRNGMVVDLQIRKGSVKAKVMGTDLYDIEVKIKPLPNATWKRIKATCSGQITSVMDLLQGKLSDRVMAIITERDSGLFPKPGEISLDCSCPDWAVMCKHVAGALYAVGAKLDHEPELLFKLRAVDHSELIESALDTSELVKKDDSSSDFSVGDLESIFGISLDQEDEGNPSMGIPPVVKKKRKIVRRKVQKKVSGNAKKKRALPPSLSRKKSVKKAVTASEPAVKKKKRVSQKSLSKKKTAGAQKKSVRKASKK
ncbi:MAG TPA: hypothetical protein EYQ50_15755 [Verrucomicrobiales bacterium]|nr:hypothetical protein [Verrucomicrobiales bacterium]